VGDIVVFEKNADATGVISEIRDRRNYIVRKSSNLSKQSHILAANLDLVLLVATINYPVTSLVFIDRFLASAEAYRVPASIVFNKTDLYTPDELEYLNAVQNLYENVGYKVFKLSALNENSIADLNEFLKDKTTLISGNSGVGKSTLINAIAPDSLAKTGKISDYHNKGMHTTTFSEMFHLKQGGRVIDTPGIKGFGAVDMDSTEISHYFVDIFAKSKDCRFSNCKHVNEPGCAVLAAVENQLISTSRYQSYISMLSDCDSGKYR
jgi:ribosome biogenesis GTPase